MMPMSNQQNPQHVALIKEASIALQNREFDQAMSVLKRLLADNSRHELGLGMLASIYAEIGMHEKAMEFYNKVLQVNPANPLARFQLGLEQLKSGQIETALSTWEPALQLENEYMVHFHYGLALQQLNRPDEAKKMFQHAAKYMPDSHILHEQLIKLLTTT